MRDTFGRNHAAADFPEQSLGTSREEAYRMVQRNAMKTWGGEGPLLDLLQKDEDVMAKLSKEQLEDLFDLDYHFKHVDTIFQRVFGRA